MENKDLNIKFIQKEQKFIIYKKESFMGVFTILGIIKYITSKISQNFLKNIEYQNESIFIEKYFCKLNEEEIILSSYFESPIMGNFEVIMKIYNEIIKIENTYIQYEIDKIIDKSEKNKILYQIKSLYYLILNHAMKLILNISEVVKSDETKSELKLSLIKYSVFITNKINNIILEKINDSKNEYNLLETEIEQLKKIKSYSEKKINYIESQIEKQDLNIKKILNYIDFDDIDEIMDLVNGNISKSEDEVKKELSQKSISDLDYKGNENFNDSDYKYSETNDEKKTKKEINYLTPTKETV